MVTSNTTTFNPDILEIIEDAMEMVGVEPRVGYDLKTARRSLDMLLREWGNRGINMWTLKQEEIPIVAGDSAAALPFDTIDVLECTWRTGSGTAQNDRLMNRYSISQWAQMTNKNETGEPSQYFVERRNPPIMRVWPVPNQNGTLVIWKLRSMEDAGKYTNTVDIVPRFLPALTSGLAFYMAMKNPAAGERVSMLQAEYERQFGLAAEEDRDRASFFMIPDLSSYNR